MSAFLEPGQRVRHPARPDWGIGQVQSVIGDRVTVNFEHAGKLLIDGDVVSDKGRKVEAGTFVLQVGKRKFAKVTLSA